MAHRRLQRQLPSETRHWMERSLHSLERAQRFEDAYALRMELADWLLEDQNREPRGNLTVETIDTVNGAVSVTVNTTSTSFGVLATNVARDNVTLSSNSIANGTLVRSVPATGRQL